ncbi:tetratricopeptide repeat protein [Desulfobulbus propionicus]|jgi:tetratricopeptide (TPR) repeat protein
MLTFDDFFLLHKPFADAVAAQLPLPATIDLYALAADGTMQTLYEHSLGPCRPVPEKIHALTQPWISEGQLVFPFPLESGEMAVAVVCGIDPPFLRKMSVSWLRETREILLDHFAAIRLSCTDPETELHNRRASIFFLQGVQEDQGGFFFLINTVFCRRTAAGNLQKLKETADLLHALGRGQYFSFGYGVFGLYLPFPARKNALKTARNLQHQLRREGMSKVQIGFARIVPVQQSNDQECLARYWRALAVAEERGPFGMCDIDAIDARHPHPFQMNDCTLQEQGKQQWRRLRQFTLALITLQPSCELTESWIETANKGVAGAGGTAIAGTGQVLLIFPDHPRESITKSIEVVLDDIRKRFGGESFHAGVAFWPCLDFTKSDVLGNCLKAQRHAAFLGPGSVVYFDHLSLNISGDYFFDEGDYRAALREYRRGLRLQPGDVNLTNSLGVTLVECNQLRGAVSCFQDALEQEPDNYMALVNLGRVRQTLGHSNRALACFERAFAVHAEERTAGQELFLPLARLYTEFGRHAEAITVLEHWMRCAGSDQEFRLFRLLGLCLLESGRPEEAMQACQKALRLFPQDSVSLSILGLLYVEQGQGTEVGLSLCAKALSLDNFNPDHWYRLARAYWYIGRYGEALDACKHCLHLHRHHAAAVVQLGMVHQAMGRMKQAKKYFAQAMSLKEYTASLADRVRGQLDQF